MPAWRTIFFAVNFTVAVALLVLCGIAVVEALAGLGSPFAFIGAVFFGMCALILAVLEWWLYVRRVKRLEVPLGISYGLLAVLAVFAFVSNAAHAGPPLPASFWIGFGSACFGIAAYTSLCCFMRVTERTFVEPEGFPVVTNGLADDSKRRARGP